MKRRVYIVLAGVLVCGGVLAAIGAQRGGGRGQAGPERMLRMLPVMRVLDADQDGVVSSAELANASAALATLDKDQDGQLTLEEMRPEIPENRGPRPSIAPPDGARGRGGPNAPVMGAIDGNGDGELSAEEIQGAAAALNALDTDGNGRLDAAELRPDFPPRR